MLKKKFRKGVKHSARPDLGSNCLQRLSADKEIIKYLLSLALGGFVT